MGLVSIVTWVFGLGVVFYVGWQVWKTFGGGLKPKDVPALREELRRKKIEAQISHEQAKINSNRNVGVPGKKGGDFGSAAAVDYLLGGGGNGGGGKPPKIPI